MENLCEKIKEVCCYPVNLYDDEGFISIVISDKDFICIIDETDIEDKYRFALSGTGDDWGITFSHRSIYDADTIVKFCHTKNIDIFVNIFRTAVEEKNRLLRSFII